MIDAKTIQLFRERYKSLTLDGRGNVNDSARSLTVGLLVNTDDPLEEGRLQVFCPSLNDSPKKLQHLPWASYVSPFGGSIDNNTFARGVGDGTATSNGAVHYGFWGVPEAGAHVLVGCIDGDPRRRFWIGCIPEQQEVHTMFSGRFDWNGKDGTPDGPLTSMKEQIQPLYDNWTKAFVDRKSREWKTRGADYEPMAVTKAGNGAPSKIKGSEYLDETYEGLSAAEKDEWVKGVLGAPGYDWTGYKNLGAFKSSRVYGMTTPGFHAFSMDDRPFNSRIKLRTATGHMLLMDDTNERIYLMTNKGNSWVEMDSNGNIDMFSEQRVSINSAKDVNITAGGTFRVTADGGIHMYAGHSTESDRGTLTTTPKRGEFRMQSEDDIHILAKNIRQKSDENTYAEVGINRYDIVGDSSFTDVTRDISVRTIQGDYIKSVANNLHETIMQDSKRLAYGKSAISSNGDNEVFSFFGGLAFGSQGDASMKSNSGDINMEAVGKEGGGSINQKTPDNQHSLSPNGIEIHSNTAITQKANDVISQEVGGTPLGMYGGISAATVVKLATSGLDLQSAADINFKSMAGSVATSYTNMVTTIDSTVTGLNMLTLYTSALTTALSSVASAAGVSMPSLPSVINISGIANQIFAGAMPPQLQALFSDMAALQAEITSLGITGITLPITIESIVSDLAGNPTLLAALGLPTNLPFPINPGILTGIDILSKINLDVLVNDIMQMILPEFRSVVSSIFENITSSSTPPAPPMPQARPPMPPITGPIA